MRTIRQAEWRTTSAILDLCYQMVQKPVVRAVLEVCQEILCIEVAVVCAVSKICNMKRVPRLPKCATTDGTLVGVLIDDFSLFAPKDM